jgi:hypothetical protein
MASYAWLPALRSIWASQSRGRTACRLALPRHVPATVRCVFTGRTAAARRARARPLAALGPAQGPMLHVRPLPLRCEHAGPNQHGTSMTPATSRKIAVDMGLPFYYSPHPLACVVLRPMPVMPLERFTP